MISEVESQKDAADTQKVAVILSSEAQRTAQLQLDQGHVQLATYQERIMALESTVNRLEQRGLSCIPNSK